MFAQFKKKYYLCNINQTQRWTNRQYTAMGKSLFEEDFTVEALSQMGNPLERLSSLVDFEMFRAVLEDGLLTKECKTPAGRKPIDVVLMFKVIFLQRLN